MILIAGGTGRLGTQVARLLTAQGLGVRVLTRDAERARHLDGDLVEIVSGDVRDRTAVERAVAGAQTIISAVHGFQGPGDVSPRTVDYEGNQNLIRATEAAGAEHLILVSMHGAGPDHPMELLRMKYLAEEELKASRLAWTIVRPTVSMETYAVVLGEPLLKKGKTQVFGRGTNPINFVSAHDVAQLVTLAAVDPALRGITVDIGGPENLSMREFVQTFQAVTGIAGTVGSIPLPLMRIMSVLLRPVKPSIARLIQAAAVMDTTDMRFDPSEFQSRYPSIHLASLSEVVRRDYLKAQRDAVSALSMYGDGRNG